MEPIERGELAIELANIASAAGRLILARRESDCHIDRKTDGSPVTTADIEAERFIRAKVSAILTDVPIIAEESFVATCKAPARFILVDPLDGTREFVAGSDEFTVNIAVIERGEPVVGAIYAPALN